MVTELIEADLNETRMKTELEALFDGEKRKVMLEKYDVLEEMLGGPGASERVAKLMIEDLRNLSRINLVFSS